MAREQAPLVVTKANSISTVHRATYLDYVGVKTFDSRGRVTGERRFLGLFTSATYSTSPREIPLLRQKVQRVIDQIGVAPVSHDGKALFHVLEGYPRDELFQASVPELMRSARGIVNIYERRRVRLFVRRDPYQRFFSCQLYVPRDRYNTLARKRIEQILLDELAGHALESQVQISESTLARLYTLVRTDPERDVTRRHRANRTPHRRDAAHLGGPPAAGTAGALPGGTRPRARGTLRQCVPDRLPGRGHGPRRARRHRRDHGVAGDGSDPRPAAAPGDRAHTALHLRLYRRGEPVAMSDLVPMLENFDLRILNERPYRIGTGRPLDPGSRSDPRRRSPARSGQVGTRFEEAFFAAWNGLAENDGFNRLVLAPRLGWRQAMILRACCRYLLQTGLPFSQRYMESVLASNPGSPPSSLDCSRRSSTPRSRGDARVSSARSGASSTRPRAGHQPGRRSHPARLPRRDCAHSAHQPLPARTPRARPRATCP